MRAGDRSLKFLLLVYFSGFLLTPTHAADWSVSLRMLG